VPHHLEPVGSWPGDTPDSVEDSSGFDDDAGELEPLVRPTWWRWVAIVVIVSMVAAGPIAYVVSRLLN
jgi:hypothetical protein